MSGQRGPSRWSRLAGAMLAVAGGVVALGLQNFPHNFPHF